MKNVPQITMPGTPQCYGVSKHCNHTLLDSVWSKFVSYRVYLELLVKIANTHFNIGNHVNSWRRHHMCNDTLLFLKF